MSQTIDSRVVEMKFDNKNFEKNVAETLKTLDQLTKRVEKLEDTQVDVDKIGKAFDGFDLSKVDKALDSITHRFSIMGQVGASVIHNLTTDAYNMVKAFGSKVWGTVFGQMKTGGKARAQNVENAKFLLEGMGITYGKEVEDQISDAVADTAFGFDEAAMAMAQLSGASVQLGDDMDKALKGISGVAAMTNRSFSDIADIFVDAAATGKVSADTFNRLSERGLAAKGIMQEFYGVTAEELDKLAKKGAISFNDFSKAMYDAFGTQAKKSNETLEGVMANTRAVLSRMGQSFYQPLMANNSEVVKFFQQLKDTLKGFEGPVKEIGAQLSGYVLNVAKYGTQLLAKIDVSKFLPAFENLKKVFENLYFSAQNLYSNILKPLGNAFKNAFYEAFPSLNTGKGLIVTLSDKLVELSQNFRKFTSEIGLFGEKGIAVKDVFVSFFNALKVGAKILKTVTTLIKAAIKVIGSAITNFNLAGIFKNFTSFITLAAQIGFYLIAGIAEGLTSGFPVLFSAIKEVGLMIINAFCSFFGIASPSKLMADKVGHWIIAGIAEGMKKALTAGLITAVILLVGALVIRCLSSVGADVQKVFNGIIDGIANTFDRFSKWISGTAFGKAFKSGFEMLAAVFDKISRVVTNFNLEKFKEIFGTIKQFVVLGAFTYIVIQFAAASTMFTTALYNISRAAKFYMSSMRIKYFGATLKNMAIAIGVITGSMLLFAGMIKAGDGKVIIQGLITIGVIMTALVFAIKLIQGAVKAESFGPHGIIKVEAMFMGLAGAIYLMASAIKKVGTLDWKQLVVGAMMVTWFLGAMTAISLALSSFSNGSDVSKSSWIPILAIAVGIRIVAGAVNNIAKIKKEDVWRAFGIVAGITILIGAMGILTQALGKINAGQFMDNMAGLNLAAMFLSIAIAVKAISKAIIQLSLVPPEKIEQGVGIVYNIMGLLAAMLLASALASKVLGQILLGVAAAVASIAASIYLIGQMKEGIIQGFGAVLVIMEMLVGFVAAINIVNRATGGSKNKGVKSLLYAGACIAAMGAVVWACGQLTIGEIFKGLFVVANLIGFVAAISALISFINGEGGLKTGKGKKVAKLEAGKMGKTIRTIIMLKTVVNSLIKVAMVAVVLAKIPLTENEITQSMLMMLGIMGTLTLLLMAVGEISKKCPNVQRMTKPILALTGAILVIAGAMLLMGQMESPATVITSAAAMGAVLLAMGRVLEKAKVFGVQGVNTKGILALSVAIIAIGAALTLMVAAFGEMSLNKFGTILVAVGSIVAVLIAIAYAVKIMNKSNINIRVSGALLLSALSLVAVAATIGLFAYYVDDLDRARDAAILLGGVMLALGITLKIAETVHWSVAFGLVAASLSLVFIAASLAGLAYYLEDLKHAWEAAGMMALLLLELGAVLYALSVLGIGTGEDGTFTILAIAGAMLVMAASLIGVSAAIYIGVAAFEKLISVLTPDNAHSVVSFFEIIGDGIGTAGQHIADGIQTAAEAIHNSMTVIKTETESAGSDVVQGLITGMMSSKGTAALAIAAAALGVIIIAALRGPKGLDCGTPSHEAIDVGANDIDGGVGKGIAENTELATKPAEALGTSIIDSLKNTISTGIKSTSFSDIWGGIKKSFSSFNVSDYLLAITPVGLPGLIGKKLWGGVGEAVGENTAKEFQNGAQNALTSFTSEGGIGSWFTSLLGGSGSFDSILGGFDWSSILGEGGIGQLGEYLKSAGVSMDNLSGDNIPKLIDQLKSAGLAGDDLTNALKELGITEEQLQNLGLADKLGLDEAKEGAEELKTSIQDLADEIIKGKFGNAPERWDRMFEALIKSGKTAQEAYAAIADAQNEVNKRLGSSVVHTADEMEKKVSESAKKAAGAATTSSKPGRDFTKDSHKAVTDTTAADAAKAAEQQMKNNMPYANYMAAKEHQITGEREKQTIEAMKQKLANEHMYTLKEKEQALHSLKANQEMMANSSLTAEKAKQLEAENKKYQAVVNTYNKQQEMLDIIKKQEEATKAAEDAEKKRGEQVNNSSKNAVVYGSAEYENQKKGVTVNNRKTIQKIETKPVQAETTVEMTPKLEVKNIDVTQYKEQIVAKVEAQVKELNSKVDITPKINTSDAEAQIKNFKSKTEELKTSIPQTFSGIASAVSKHFIEISSKIFTEGGKLTANTRAVFQNAVSAATGVLTSAETISKFYNAGKNATQGYVNGMKANLASVKSAGNQIAQFSANATKKTLKEKSPSKLFYGIGSYAGEGYANGILSTLGLVAAASASMGEASADELFNVANAIQSTIDEGIDINPSIVPVIDTTHIQNGIDYINSSFNRDQTMDILADINATKMTREADTEAMQSQISSLRGGLNDLATAILNQPDPTVNANVILQGDANGVFKLVRTQDGIYTKMHGKSAFA